MSVDAACAAPASAVDVAWIRRVTPVEGDTNRSRWPTDPIWQVVQSAEFTDADPSARRLMRREQRLCSVKHLDAGAYGYLISRTAYVHPEGEYWDVSWAARELVGSLGKIAEAPDKEFGPLVRERRRQRGLPVSPAASILPDLPAPPHGQDAVSLAAVNRAADVALQDDTPADELHAARVRLTERPMTDAFVALEEAQKCGATETVIARCATVYANAEMAYRTLMGKIGP